MGQKIKVEEFGHMLHELLESLETIQFETRDTCFYCGQPFVGDWPEPTCMVIDHLFPRARGGGDESVNRVQACNRCNSAKNAKHPLDFWLTSELVSQDWAGLAELLIRTIVATELERKSQKKIGQELRTLRAYVRGARQEIQEILDTLTSR